MHDKDNHIINDHVEIIDTITDADEFSINDEKNDQDGNNGTAVSLENLSNLFKGRNLAFVSTLSSDGSPHVTPVWSDIDDENNILINTAESSVKNINVEKDPRIAISVVEQYNPYNMISIKGKVIEKTFTNADEHLRKLAIKYLGFGKYYYRKPKNRRIILKVKPEKIMGLSLHPAFYFLAYSPFNTPNQSDGAQKGVQ
ncbi:MAG TPA: TIGR03618 family F420-dependent PPOX class oxidoreductase [Candidatus Nitrosocosmicus sp.]